MPIAQALLPEFDHEMATTRSLLERVPEHRAAWRPHPKSTELGALAIHVANLVGLAPRTMALTEVDMNPPGEPGFTPPGFTSTAALLETFDENVAKAREAIAGASDEEMMVPWSLKSGGHTIFTMPRAAVLRTMVMNHVIHHRGQLSVYLRQNEVPLPSIYGPTADTQG
ncbi:MAG TPA: DinB family protein [Longimicrobiaceae bacterium]|nr:DinB family protein [Longimicrobiaceae bacterium]